MAVLFNRNCGYLRAMRDFPASLLNSPLLGQASPALIETFERTATRDFLESGETLFYQGDIGDKLFLLETGTLEISVLSATGRKISLNVLGAGDIFGEIALFDPGPRTATVTALAPCTLTQIRRADLFVALRETPDLALEMIRLAGERLRHMSEQFEQQVFLPAETRLAVKLLFLADRLPKDDASIIMSQSDLAEHVGVTREVVSKTLQLWKVNRWIELGRGRIRILDIDALRELASSELN